MSLQSEVVSPQIDAYFDNRSHLKHYINYKEHVSLTRNIDDVFISLKGISSSTPFFHSSAFGDITGGGFYFRFGGKGIAVDPGIGFVAQMHKNNVFIDDIDFVVITHNHIDHSNDASSLSAMNFDYNRYLGREHEFFSEFFDIDKPKHSIVWIVDDASSVQIKKFIDNENELILLSDIADNGSVYHPISDDIAISAIHTKHIQNSEDSFGIKIKFQDDACAKIWGYSSDTAFFHELPSFLGDCETLILNVSDIYRSDVHQNRFKNSHLGYSGCVEIIKNTNAELVLVSEFACINGDNRFDIAELLSKCDTKTKVLPTEVGLKISIPFETVFCSCCNRPSSLSNIKTIRPRRSFSNLIYVCNNCLL